MVLATGRAIAVLFQPKGLSRSALLGRFHRPMAQPRVRVMSAIVGLAVSRGAMAIVGLIAVLSRRVHPMVHDLRVLRLELRQALVGREIRHRLTCRLRTRGHHGRAIMIDGVIRPTVVQIVRAAIVTAGGMINAARR